MRYVPYNTSPYESERTGSWPVFVSSVLASFTIHICTCVAYCAEGCSIMVPFITSFVHVTVIISLLNLLLHTCSM